MSIWNVIYRFTWVVLTGMILVAFGIMFWPLVMEHRALQQKETELLESIRTDELRIRELKLKQERFANDPDFVERIAHDIGLARPNETIFRFVDEENQDAPPPAGVP
jgi:cell division protein FtsB